MGEWKECKIGDVIKFGNGKVRPNSIGKIPVYGGNGILSFCDEANYENETIIIGRVGAYCGAVYYENKPIWVSDNALAAKPKEKFNAKFLFYLLKNLELNQFAEGSSHPLVTQSLLNSIDVLITDDESEQRAIASVLSSLDDKIDLLQRENQTLEQIAETLFRQLFVEEASDDWEEVPLGNSSLATIIKSGIHYFEGAKIYLETGDVDNTEIKGGKPVTYKNRPSRANMEPLPYSVWFAKKGGVRKLLMFDDYAFNINDLILSTGFTGLKTTKLSHYYLWCYLLSSEFQDIKDNFISGSVQPDINNESLLQIMVLKPENETLIKFNQIVENYFHKISINRKQISVLERLRDTLLPKLMSGEVRVTLTEEKA